MDAQQYFSDNPDVAQAYQKYNYGMSPEGFAEAHYLLYGQKEKRAAPTTLDPYYLANPDVAQAYQTNRYEMNPNDFIQAQYLKYGMDEQRAAPEALNPYFVANPDVAQAYKANTYGLTPDQFAAAHFAKFGQKEQRVAPTAMSQAALNPFVSPLPTTQTATAGQLRELFPSFAESKRLAGEMVANRPTMQSIVDMLKGDTSRQYFADNPDVASAYKTNNFNLSPNEFVAQHYAKYGMGEGRASPVTPMPSSLNNVLSMISK
jgi:hypothetical protein